MNFDYDFMAELEKHFDDIYVRHQKCNEIKKVFKLKKQEM